MFSPRGPSLRELAVQALSSVEGGYDLLAPKFDLAMRVRNVLWRPAFVMYYRTCPLSAVRHDLTTPGFTVTTVPLTALGRREDGSPRCRLVLARRASPP